MHKWTAYIQASAFFSFAARLSRLRKGPEDTPFAGGTFKLAFLVPDRYPLAPPAVRFVTQARPPSPALSASAHAATLPRRAGVPPQHPLEDGRGVPRHPQRCGVEPRVDAPVGVPRHRGAARVPRAGLAAQLRRGQLVAGGGHGGVQLDGAVLHGGARVRAAAEARGVSKRRGLLAEVVRCAVQQNLSLPLSWHADLSCAWLSARWDEANCAEAPRSAYTSSISLHTSRFHSRPVHCVCVAAVTDVRFMIFNQELCTLSCCIRKKLVALPHRNDNAYRGTFLYCAAR